MKINLKHLTGLWSLGLLVLTQASRVAAGDFDSNLEKSFPVSDGGKLMIEADRGSIVVATDGTDKVQVQVLRRVSGGDKANADELFANHVVTFSQDGNKVSVVAKDKKEQRSWAGNRPGLQVRYRISLPKKFDVDLKTAGGDITVGPLEGNAATRTSSGSIKLSPVTGNVEAADAGGSVLVEAAGGKVSARTSSGSIEVRKAGGKIDVSDAGGDIRIGEAGSDLTAATSSGSIKVSNAQGNVDVKDAGGNIGIEAAGGDVNAATSSGSITINSAKGDVSARNAGGDITIGDAGSVAAQTSSGSIRIKNAKGSVEARNAGGNISVQDAGGKLALHTSSGNIQIGRARSTVEAHDAGGSIGIEDAQGAVEAHTSSGNIKVNFSVAPKSDSRLEVSGGGISVGLPRTAGVDLDAKSSGGRVESQHPVAVVVHENSPRGSLTGKINGGGPKLFLRSSSGDVRITATEPVQAEVSK